MRYLTGHDAGLFGLEEAIAWEQLRGLGEDMYSSVGEGDRGYTPGVPSTQPKPKPPVKKPITAIFGGRPTITQLPPEPGTGYGPAATGGLVKQPTASGKAPSPILLPPMTAYECDAAFKRRCEVYGQYVSAQQESKRLRAENQSAASIRSANLAVSRFGDQLARMTQDLRNGQCSALRLAAIEADCRVTAPGYVAPLPVVLPPPLPEAPVVAPPAYTAAPPVSLPADLPGTSVAVAGSGPSIPAPTGAVLPDDAYNKMDWGAAYQMWVKGKTGEQVVQERKEQAQAKAAQDKIDAARKEAEAIAKYKRTQQQYEEAVPVFTRFVEAGKKAANSLDNFSMHEQKYSDWDTLENEFRDNYLYEDAAQQIVPAGKVAIGQDDYFKYAAWKGAGKEILKKGLKLTKQDAYRLLLAAQEGAANGKFGELQAAMAAEAASIIVNRFTGAPLDVATVKRMRSDLAEESGLSPRPAAYSKDVIVDTMLARSDAYAQDLPSPEALGMSSEWENLPGVTGAQETARLKAFNKGTQVLDAVFGRISNLLEMSRTFKKIAGGTQPGIQDAATAYFLSAHFPKLKNAYAESVPKPGRTDGERYRAARAFNTYYNWAIKDTMIQAMGGLDALKRTTAQLQAQSGERGRSVAQQRQDRRLDGYFLGVLNLG